jgi:uncharacterized protein YxeA
MKAIYSVIFLPFVFILLIVTPVKGSSDWEEFNTYKGKVYSYNKVNIKHGANDIVQVWVKTVYSNEGRERDLVYMRKQGLATAKEWDKLSDRLSLVELDCKKERTRVISITYYDSDGGILYSKSSDKQDWKSIVSNSSFDILRKKVCK